MKKMLTILTVIIIICVMVFLNCSAASVTDGNNYYTLGDINTDGYIDARDIVRLKKYLSNKQTKIILCAADLNSDDNINALDLTVLRKYLLSEDASLISGEHWTDFY